METPPEFVDITAECAYWKERARNLKVELEEFAEDSHQLEKELEITIKLRDDQLTDLRHKYNKQQHENDNLQGKCKQYEHELNQWEQRHQKEKVEKEHLKKYTRELEQKNDDLERAHRIVTESMTEIERMLNREYEKNVMLEVECEMEKENAQIQLQRLMDEARDLKQELKIRKRHPSESEVLEESVATKEDNLPELSNPKLIKNLINVKEEETTQILLNGINSAASQNLTNSSSNNHISNNNGYHLNGTATTTATISCQTTPSHSRQATVQRENSLKQMDRIKNGAPMTASSRSTALAIVADLLRRVNLDTKLICAQCKKFRCECPEKGGGGASDGPNSSHPAPVVDSRNSWSTPKATTTTTTSRTICDKNEDEPIRLSSIFSGSTTTPSPSSSSSCTTTPVNSGATTTSSWILDKIQTTTNRLMANKNIDATLKDLKRPKSLYDDLGNINNNRTGVDSQTVQANDTATTKSPSSLIY